MIFPSQVNPLPDKSKILQAYKGAQVDDLPTPAFVVDRAKFKHNCAKILKNSKSLKADFRAHIKTHKTLEGSLLQLGDGATDKLIVSTLREAWHIVPLAEQGLVKDVLFSLPVVKSRLEEFVQLSSKFENFRLMLDNEDQLDSLIEYSQSHKGTKKWSIFIKVDMGYKRAGLPYDSASFHKVVEKALKHKQYIDIYGFYCHAGHSYQSKSEVDAKNFLLEEILHANNAARAALELDSTLVLQLSVGATPTAHASESLTLEELSAKLGGDGKLLGNLEIHAGNYTFCDLQQVSTGCVDIKDVSCKVIAEVISTYPGRGSNNSDEILINAGVTSLAREHGQLPGHGRIIEPVGHENWIVGKVSQEHGILVPLDKSAPTEIIPIGTKVSIIPQHSCISANSQPWYYVTDGDNTVVDIWVPARGW